MGLLFSIKQSRACFEKATSPADVREEEKCYWSRAPRTGALEQPVWQGLLKARLGVP